MKERNPHQKRLTCTTPVKRTKRENIAHGFFRNEPPPVPASRRSHDHTAAISPLSPGAGARGVFVEIFTDIQVHG